MREGNLIRVGGRRASDGGPAPAFPSTDAELEAAIDGDQIALRFQPQIDCATGRIVGVEALSRWEGAANAEALFARAGKAHLSEHLSRSVQRKALWAAGRWRGPLEQLGISINLVPEELEREGVERALLDDIATAGLAPERVTVEIVESSLVADRPVVAKRLACLRAAGVRIAIDDFGTGYSSLVYLTSLPLDAIKIDRGLIIDIVGGNRQQIVVKALIRLARELNLKVVVEGVEDAAQLDLLRTWGCDLYQGFLGARALDEVALARFVAATH